MHMMGGTRSTRTGGTTPMNHFLKTIFVVALALAVVFSPVRAEAQNYRFNSVSIEGNQRIESATILTYAGIERGETVSAGDLNDAYQRILGTGLFEQVEIEPRGGTLAISVIEFPTISRIAFEGNNKI